MIKNEGAREGEERDWKSRERNITGRAGGEREMGREAGKRIELLYIY